MKKMKVIQKALEQGASVELNFHKCETKEQAESVIKSIAHDLDTDYSHDTNGNHKWFDVVYETDERVEIEAAAFYEN